MGPSDTRSRRGSGVSSTESRRNAPDDDEAAEELGYRTGRQYQPSDDESQSRLPAHKDLSGDGLDALEPELPPRPSAASIRLKTDVTRTGPPLKLEVVAGPDLGAVFPVSGIRVTIGRADGVSWRLSDTTVSRRHVEIVIGDEGALLRDLKSGNGTKVNGALVEEQLLQHGDEIRIGTTRIRFVNEQQAFAEAQAAAEAAAAQAAQEHPAIATDQVNAASQPAAGASGAYRGRSATGGGGQQAPHGEPLGSNAGDDVEGEGDDEVESEGDDVAGEGDEAQTEDVRAATATRPAATWAYRIGRLIGYAVLVGGAVGGWLWWKKPPPTTNSDERAVQWADAARGMLTVGRFEEALAMLTEAKAAAPQAVDPALLESVSRSLKAHAALDEARALFDDGKFTDAKAQLARLELTEATAAPAAQLSARIAEVEQGLLEARVGELVTSDQLDEADRLIKQLAPERRARWAGLVNEALQKRERERVSQNNGQHARAADRERERREALLRETTAAFAAVQRKFSGEEWDRAAKECDRVVEQTERDDLRGRARSLQRLIPQFGAMYSEGMRHYRNGELAAAYRLLAQSRPLYQDIGLVSPILEQLDDALYEAAMATGREAFLADNLAGALRAYEAALTSRPHDNRARQGLEAAQARVEQMVQAALGLEARQAKSRLRDLLKVVSPSSELAGRIQRSIEELQ